jgi:hypothetical protein
LSDKALHERENEAVLAGVNELFLEMPVPKVLFS